MVPRARLAMNWAKRCWRCASVSASVPFVKAAGFVALTKPAGSGAALMNAVLAGMLPSAPAVTAATRRVAVEFPAGIVTSASLAYPVAPFW